MTSRTDKLRPQSSTAGQRMTTRIPIPAILDFKSVCSVAQRRISERLDPLLGGTSYDKRIAGCKIFDRWAVTRVTPPVASGATVVHTKRVNCVPYRSGLVAHLDALGWSGHRPLIDQVVRSALSIKPAPLCASPSTSRATRSPTFRKRPRCGQFRRTCR